MNTDAVIQAAQSFMQQSSHSVEGWLIHDYRYSNPIMWQALGGRISNVTRPCWLYVPASGEPVLIVHHVDAGRFQNVPFRKDVYRNRETMIESLAKALPSGRRVAMEYSPLGSIPRVSKVDAGTVELVRDLGVDVTSSGDLLQYATQRWGEAQLASHKRTAGKLGLIVLEAFDYIGKNLSPVVTEHAVAEFIRGRFREENIHSPDGPIVAANGHAGDPHYEPQPDGPPFKEGDWVLIDLWAREESEEGVYADITWVAYIGDEPSQRCREVFDIVVEARDAALEFIQEAHADGRTVEGRDVDYVAREVITGYNYGDYFTHRLGHSISGEVHGDAVNLDSFETDDRRTIIPGICFSIEPGIYLPDFGMRSEIDVFMSEEGPVPTTAIQREIVLILG